MRRDLQREIAELVRSQPELANMPPEQILEMAAAVDLGIWSEVKVGFTNSGYHWEWYELAQHARRLALIAPREHGKALALDTPVATPDGFRPIGCLKPGDAVIGRFGLPDRVIATTVVQYDRPCYRVTFNDGSSFIADEEHEWFTHYAWRGDRVVTTKKILEDLKARDDQKHVVDGVCVELPDADLPLDPYLFGQWLGDGTSLRGELTTADSEAVDAFVMEGFQPTYRYERGKAATYGFKGLWTVLKGMGVLGNKHVPEQYLWASRKQRLALLQGLMDSDGHCSDRGQVEFCSTSSALRDAVLHLVSSLGWKAKLAEDRARLNGTDHGPRYRVWWYPDEPVFRLERKYNKQRVLPDGRRSKATGRAVVSVEPVESVPVVCIQTGTGGYLIGERFVLTHNSECVTVNNASWTSIYNPGFWTYIFCNSGDQGEKILSRIASTVSHVAPHLVDKAKVFHAKEIVFANDARVTVRGSGAAVRGAHPDLIIGDDVQDENNTSTQMQRERLKQWWFGTVGGMAHPGTTRVVMPVGKKAERRDFPATRILLVGTPFHSLDLLMSCKDNPMYRYELYSAMRTIDRD